MEANNINPDQTGISLIWVHIACNIGYLRTQEDDRADGKIPNWQKFRVKIIQTDF